MMIFGCVLCLIDGESVKDEKKKERGKTSRCTSSNMLLLDTRCSHDEILGRES